MLGNKENFLEVTRREVEERSLLTFKEGTVSSTGQLGATKAHFKGTVPVFPSERAVVAKHDGYLKKEGRGPTTEGIKENSSATSVAAFPLQAG